MTSQIRAPMVEVQGHRMPSDLEAQKVAQPPSKARALLRKILPPSTGKLEEVGNFKVDTIDVVPSSVYPFAGAYNRGAQSNM